MLKADIKSWGMLLLGIAAVTVAALMLHFYITQVLPTKNIFVSCMTEDNTTVIFIHNNSTEYINKVDVELDGTGSCSIEDVPQNSSDLCKTSGKYRFFRAVIYTKKGTIKRAGQCFRVEKINWQK